MKVFILLTLFLINLTAIKAGFYTKCEIRGVDRYDWLGRYSRRETIEDVHDGLIVTYPTENILGMIAQSSKYLKAVFENETLSIYTTAKYKDFEKEYDGYDEILLSMTFQCIEDKEETLQMYQKVKDTNNHDPLLTQEVYQYHFGMPLPEGYDLTKFLPISANDTDFSNRDIYFQIDYNNDLVVTYHGESNYDSDDYYTSFKTLREIKGPFRQEYTLVAIDGGQPARNTTARLILTVASNNSNAENGNGTEGNTSHPPVFAQHLYFATYTADHNLEMNEVITIKYGVEESTTIKQSGYTEYFQISLSDPKTSGSVQVKRLKPLPKHNLETTDLLIIEIEAENEDFRHMPGRTALIVRLPPHQKEDPNNKSHNCNINHSINFQHSDSVVLVLFFISVVVIIVIINIFVLLRYFQRRNLIHAASNNNIEVVVDEVKQQKQPHKC